MAMWNPWRGCKKCSDGCLHCYIHKGDYKRGINTNDIVKTKDFYKPIEKLKNGSKKVGEILSEAKINKLDRDRYPIVCDDNGKILWIPGVKKSKFDRQINEEYDIIIKYIKKENNDEKK